jgi:hypothetical protein
MVAAHGSHWAVSYQTRSRCPQSLQSSSNTNLEVRGGKLKSVAWAPGRKIMVVNPPFTSGSKVYIKMGSRAAIIKEAVA